MGSVITSQEEIVQKRITVLTFTVAMVVTISLTPSDPKLNADMVKEDGHALCD